MIMRSFSQDNILNFWQDFCDPNVDDNKRHEAAEKLIHAIKYGCRLCDKIEQELIVMDTEKIISVNTLHPQWILFAQAAWQNKFIEPIWFDDLSNLLQIDVGEIRKCIMWAYASAIVYGNTADRVHIRALNTYLNDKSVQHSVLFIFRKLSEFENNLSIVLIPDSLWDKLLLILVSDGTEEDVQLNILYIINNIIKKATEQDLQRKLYENLQKWINNSSVSKSIFNVTVSILCDATLVNEKLFPQIDGMLKEKINQIDDEDILDRISAAFKRTSGDHELCICSRNTLVSHIKTELVATQTQSVSRTLDESIEPEAKFLSLDHLFDQNSYINHSCGAEIRPLTVVSGNNWYFFLSTVPQLNIYAALAKKGQLTKEDFVYLESKFSDGWHFTFKSRDYIYETIANVFNESAQKGQHLSFSILEKLSQRLGTDSESLNRSCARCLLSAVYNQQLLSRESDDRLDEVLRTTKDMEVKTCLIQLKAYRVSKGDSPTIDMDQILDALRNKKACEEAGYLLFRAAAVKKMLFTERQLKFLSNVSGSTDYNEEVRQYCLQAIIHNIKQMKEINSLPKEVFSDLDLILNDKVKSLQHLAAAAFCYYVNNTGCSLSQSTIIKLGAMLITDCDTFLKNNILLVFLNLAKHKEMIPMKVLVAVSEVLYENNIDLRSNAIMILHHVIDHGIDLNLTILDAIEFCLNDFDHKIQNTSGTLFIKSLKQSSSYSFHHLEKLTLIFRNGFKPDVQKAALIFLKDFVSKQKELPDSLLQLVEQCLSAQDISIVQSAIDILEIYCHCSCLCPRTICCLERTLVVDTSIALNTVSILITVVRMNHKLREKTLTSLGNMLFRADEPSDIYLLLHLADRLQPIPSIVNDQLIQTYLSRCIRHSVCEQTRQNALDQLTVFTMEGKQLSKYTYETLFITINHRPHQDKVLKILLNSIQSGQYPSGNHVFRLCQILLETTNPSVNLIHIFSHIVAENRTISTETVQHLHKFLTIPTLSVYIVGIYRTLIERQELINLKIIYEVLGLAKGDMDHQLRTQLAVFLKVASENYPDPVYQEYLLDFLQLQESVENKKNACLAAKALAQPNQLLLPGIISALSILLLAESNPDILSIICDVLGLAYINDQTLQTHVKCILDLVQQQNTADDWTLLQTMRKAVESGYQLREEHFAILIRILYGCESELRAEAAKIVALSASEYQNIPDNIVDAIYATLLDETVNIHTIEILSLCLLSKPSGNVIDKILYLSLLSVNPQIRKTSLNLLKTYAQGEKVIKYIDSKEFCRKCLLPNENISDPTERLSQMMNSNRKEEVQAAYNIVQLILSSKQTIPNTLLHIIASHLTSNIPYDESCSRILIEATKQDTSLNKNVVEEIEEAFNSFPTIWKTRLIRTLTDRSIVLQDKTIEKLLSLLETPSHLKDFKGKILEAMSALENVARYQALPQTVLNYFIHRLENDSIDIVQKSFSIVQHQIIQCYTDDLPDILSRIKLLPKIDLHKLYDLKTLDEFLITIETLLMIDNFDLNVFNSPATQWSRECLCIELLANISDKSSDDIITFYHHLAQLELFKQYELCSVERDSILKALIQKQKQISLQLSKINEILLYLQTFDTCSIKILRSNDSRWFDDLRRTYIKEKVNDYWTEFEYSQSTLDHIIDCISELDIISYDFIKLFILSASEPQQILTLIQFLTEKQVNKNDLCEIFMQLPTHATFSVLKTELEMSILKKRLLSIWHNRQDQLAHIYNSLRSLLMIGWTFDEIDGLLNKMQSQESSSTLAAFLEVLTLLDQYGMSNKFNQTVDDVISNTAASSWAQQTLVKILEDRFTTTSSEKNLNMLLEEICAENNSSVSVNVKKLHTDFMEIKEKYNQEFKEHSLVKPIRKWVKEDIKTWAGNIDSSWANNSRNLTEIIMVIKRAVELNSNYEPRCIQILAILLVCDPNLRHGRLLQIATGEGKSTIIAILAVIKALQGKHVDIVTSSITLAKRDVCELTQFYDLFNLTVSHNNDDVDYVIGLKACYKCDIVYGNASQFQFDLLRHEFSFHKTRGVRRFDCVIIDEVDSMLIDENNTIARLADQLPGMGWLNPLLYGIWTCINTATEHEVDQSQVVERIKTLLHDRTSALKVPNHLHEFTLDSLPIWVEHAILARNVYKIDHHYTIKADEMGIKRIIPIDFSNTGVMQCSTTWSDGLHQFLQIKHGLKMTPLNVTTNYLSNVVFFGRYADNIYGFTGTLGSDDAQKLLCHIYSVDTVIIPSFKQKQRIKFPPVLMPTYQAWIQRIVSSSVTEAMRDRAVLIICETRVDAHEIAKLLHTECQTICIRTYTDNTNMAEVDIVNNRIESREIVVATNLAGRGTDLKMSQNIEKNGGLHVCLTFLPNNLRIEEQAFGRTSRQGRRGTSQLIIDEQRTLLRLMALYPQYKDSEESEQYTDKLDMLFDWRRKAESARLELIQKEEITSIKEKDSLFQSFCDLLKEMRNKNDDSYKLASVRERWGLWLKSTDQRLRNRSLLQRTIEDAGFQCVVSPSNQDSFFHAIAYQMRKQLDIESIKSEVIDHIRTNYNLYEKIIAVIKEDNYNGCMADKLRCLAISRVLNMNIIVFHSNQLQPIVYKRENALYTCYLGWVVNGYYISLEHIDAKVSAEDLYLTNADTDSVEFKKDEKDFLSYFSHRSYESDIFNIFTIENIDVDLKYSFQRFTGKIRDEYMTDAIIQNPCYFILATETIIANSTSLFSKIRSRTERILSINQEADTFDKAICLLEQAVKLDSIFAFPALVYHAYLVLNEHKSPEKYKLQAKVLLQNAREKIRQYILPQLCSVQSLQHEKHELIYDDLNKQQHVNVELIDFYGEHIERAIFIIEKSEKMIDIHETKIDHIRVGEKMNTEKTLEFVKCASGKLDIHFHDLTVTEDMGIKTDLALNLLSLLFDDNKNISLRFSQTTSEILRSIIARFDHLESISLTLNDLDNNEILELLSMNNNNTVSLTLFNCDEKYSQTIAMCPSKILMDTGKVRKYIAPDKVDEYLKQHMNNLRSLTFESINKALASEIVGALDNVKFAMTYEALNIPTISVILETVSKSISFCLKNFSKTSARRFIEKTSERNFTLCLHDLDAKDAFHLLQRFDRKEQNVTTNFKRITDYFPLTNQTYEELNNFTSVGITEVILVNELSPRPWLSAAVTAGLGVSQVVGGICMAAVTAGFGVNIGLSLIAEGINDMYFAVRGAVSRNISWKDYAQQKAISLTLCFASFGFSAIRQSAQAAKMVGKTGTQLVKSTIKGGSDIILNSFKTLGSEVVEGAASTTWKLACKQVAIVSAETGFRELANHSVDVFFDQNITPHFKHVILEEIEGLVRAKESTELYYTQILTRAIWIDTYYKNNRLCNKIEEIAVAILTQKKNEYTEIAKSLAMGLSNSLLNHAGPMIDMMNNGKSSRIGTFVNVSKNLLPFLPSMSASYEVTTILNKFFETYTARLEQLEEEIPTFTSLLIDASNDTLRSAEANEMFDLLKEKNIVDSDGLLKMSALVGQYNSEFLSDPHQDLVTSYKIPIMRLEDQVRNMFSNTQNHADYVIAVLSKFPASDDIRADGLHKRISGVLANQIFAIIHGVVFAPLSNYVIGIGIKTLSEKFQRKVDPNGPVDEQLVEEGAKRSISILSSDLFRKINSCRFELRQDAVSKLQELEKNMLNGSVSTLNYLEELSLEINNQKQGGIIEIGVIAMLTGKPISIIQQQISEKSNDGDGRIRLRYTLPYIDSETKQIIDGHYEAVDAANIPSIGKNDCLYTAMMNAIPFTFKSEKDVRTHVAAFVLMNADYIERILPAINTINANPNPLRRKALMMEGGTDNKYAWDKNKIVAYLGNIAHWSADKTRNAIIHLRDWIDSNPNTLMWIDIGIDLSVILCPEIAMFKYGNKVIKYGSRTIKYVRLTKIAKDLINDGQQLYKQWSADKMIETVKDLINLGSLIGFDLSSSSNI